MPFSFKSAREIFAVALLCLSLAFTIKLALHHDQGHNLYVSQLLQQAQDETSQAAALIDDQLNKMVAQTERLADQIRSGALTPDDLRAQLSQQLLNEAKLDAMVLVSENPGSGGETLPTGFYMGKDLKNRIRIRDLNLSAVSPDFDKNAAWYADTQLIGAHWLEPFSVAAGEPLALGYGVSITLPVPGGGTRAGVLVLMVNQARLIRETDSIQAGNYGFPLIYTQAGNYLVHPFQNGVGGSTRNLFRDAWLSDRPHMANMALTTFGSERGSLEHIDLGLGQKACVFFCRIPSANLVLANLVFHEDLRQNHNLARQSYLRIILAGIWCVALAGFVIHLFGLMTLGWLKLYVAMFSCLAGFCIGLTWFLADLYPPEGVGQVKLLNQSTLKRLEGQYLSHIRNEVGQNLELLETGVYLQSVEYLSSMRVKVTGSVWQRLTREQVEAGFKPGFIFPEAEDKDPGPPSIEEEGRLYRWRFNADLRQAFDYSLYPVDRQQIWLRMVYPGLHQNVILTPALDSYSSIAPDALPGIAYDLVLPEYQKLESYFDFRLQQYNTAFGREERVFLLSRPELFFNLKIKRKFIGPLISQVIPVLVCAALLFALVITFSRNDQEGVLGFSVTTVALGCAALFFVVISQHIDLRNDYVSESVIYFEYFYFSLYLLMILILIYTCVFALRGRWRLLEQQDHLAAKILYWPIFCCSNLAAAIWVFY